MNLTRLGSKFQKKLLGQTKFVKKKIGSRKDLGQRKFCLEKLDPKKFRSKKYFSQFKENFWLKICVPKTILGECKIFGPKKFWVGKNSGSKIFYVQ